MTPATILLVAAAFAFVSATAAAYLAVRYREDDIGPMLALLAIFIALVCGLCVSEAVKESRLQHGSPAQEVAK